MEENFSMDRGGGVGLGMTQAHYIRCAFISIITTSGPPPQHQALDPGDWGPFLYSLPRDLLPSFSAPHLLSPLVVLDTHEVGQDSILKHLQCCLSLVLVVIQ